jgi:hypothetical protein
VLAAGGSVVRSASGSGAGLSWTWDGRDEAGNRVADGQYAVQLTATDAAGNGAALASALVIVDTLAPQGVGLFHPSRGDGWGVGETVYTNRNPLPVHGYTGQASDRVTVNGAPVAVSGVLNEFAAALTLAAGAQTLTVLAEDEAGNQTPLTRTVAYDDQGPTASAWRPSGVTNQSQAPVSARFDRRGGSAIDMSHVKLYRGGVDVTASAVISAGGLTYLPDPPLAEGENEFHVTLVNLAGNVGEAGWSVTVDRQSQVALLSPLDGAVLNAITQTVSGQSEAGATVALALAGQPLGQTTADAGGYFTLTNLLFPADGHGH